MYSFSRAWENELILANKSEKKKYKPSLLHATWQTYKVRYCIVGLCLFIYVC